MRGLILAPAVVVALLAASGAPPAGAAPTCTCRAQGRDIALGHTACLMTPKGGRVATCGLVLNNTSWTISETPCTVSALMPRLRQAWWQAQRF